MRNVSLRDVLSPGHGVFNGLQRGERQGFIPGRFRPVAAQDGASIASKRAARSLRSAEIRYSAGL